MNDFYRDLGEVINKEEGDTGKSTFSPTFVQFIINAGFRMNFTKHQGFELGVRIPTINDPYFKVTETKAVVKVDDKGNLTGEGKGSEATLAFRRNASLYWNYVYNF